MHMHACFQLFLVVLTSPAHKQSTLTQVPSQVSNHFAHLPSSSCRCVETPLSSIVSQRKRKFAQLWERQFEKILLHHGWEKVSNWECFFGHRQKGLFLTVYLDDMKLVGKEQNIYPMWKVLSKEVDLGEPISFLDHVFLVCTQTQCELSKDIVDNNRTMF